MVPIYRSYKLSPIILWNWLRYVCCGDCLQYTGMLRFCTNRKSIKPANGKDGKMTDNNYYSSKQSNIIITCTKSYKYKISLKEICTQPP